MEMNLKPKFFTESKVLRMNGHHGSPSWCPFYAQLSGALNLAAICLNHECKAVIDNDGRVWYYMPAWAAESPCHDMHDLSYPLDAPTPGTWSFHS